MAGMKVVTMVDTKAVKLIVSWVDYLVDRMAESLVVERVE